MSLSEQELRALREIEESLMADDPKFGNSVKSAEKTAGGQGGFPLRALAIGVVGLIMLIGGVALAQISMWFIAISIAGFLVMFGAGIWGLQGGGVAPGSGSQTSDASQKQKNASGGRPKSRMEDDFRRRFEGH